MLFIPIALALAEAGLGCSTPVETHIKGEFNGWDDAKIYSTDDGSMWEQSSYHYHYHYAYHPAALIYERRGHCHMKIDGDSDEGADVRLLSGGATKATLGKTRAGLFVPANRDPRINGSLNPNINGSINPAINGSLNPMINGSVNPTINGSINPMINGSINPTINGSLNPNINGSINPNIVTSLNPTIGSWSGFYVFEKGGDVDGMAVRASDLLLLFAAGGAWFGYLVPNGAGGFNRFSVSGTWTGYAISNGSEGFNLFDKDGNWTGFMC